MKTAMQILFDNIKNSNKNEVIDYEKFKEDFLEKEKQQIIASFKAAYTLDASEEHQQWEAEEYYNETFTEVLK